MQPSIVPALVVIGGATATNSVLGQDGLDGRGRLFILRNLYLELFGPSRFSV